MTRFIIGAAILFFVALTKIMIALARGRHNVFFLVLLTLLAIFLAYKVSNPFRTLKGSHLLADLRTLFGSLKNRASGLTPGGATGELALLAAVFGMAALPTTVFPMPRRSIRRLLRPVPLHLAGLLAALPVAAVAAAGVVADAGASDDGSLWNRLAPGVGCGNTRQSSRH